MTMFGVTILHSSIRAIVATCKSIIVNFYADFILSMEEIHATEDLISFKEQMHFVVQLPILAIFLKL